MLKIPVTLAFVMMLGFPVAAEDGSTLNASASVSIFENLHVHLLKGLHFGRYSRADRKALKFWLHQDNGWMDLKKGTSGWERKFLNHNRGAFLIHGQKNVAITYVLDITENFSAAGWELVDLISFPPSPSVLGDGGELTVYFGAKLNVSEVAKHGMNGKGRAAIITIAVNYQ